MTSDYTVVTLTQDEQERLRRTYTDLMELAACRVPAVRAAARAAVAHIAQALNGEGMGYELYTGNWQD